MLSRSVNMGEVPGSLMSTLSESMPPTPGAIGESSRFPPGFFQLTPKLSDLGLGDQADLGAEDGIALEPVQGLDIGEMGLDEEGPWLGGEPGDLDVAGPSRVELERALDLLGSLPGESPPAVGVRAVGI